MASELKILVLGGDLVGLVTAVQLQQNFVNAKITILVITKLFFD